MSVKTFFLRFFVVFAIAFVVNLVVVYLWEGCLLYTSPSPRDAHESRMPSSA